MTKEKEDVIDEILKLNNSSEDVTHINKFTQGSRIIIREQKEYYAIQIGDSYPITYKINRKSGKIYDYEDPYRDFYPTPEGDWLDPNPIGDEWIEMKE